MPMHVCTKVHILKPCMHICIHRCTTHGKDITNILLLMLWHCLISSGTADCLLATVNSVDENVTGRIFTLNNASGNCDATTVVFVYDPLEQDWGKILVRVYQNGTIMKGHGIYLEREFKCAFTT